MDHEVVPGPMPLLVASLWRALLIAAVLALADLPPGVFNYLNL